MERLHEIAAIHQGHPSYVVPGRVTDRIRQVLESASLLRLLDRGRQ
jgi:hypothetical protein